MKRVYSRFSTFKGRVALIAAFCTAASFSTLAVGYDESGVWSSPMADTVFTPSPPWFLSGPPWLVNAVSPAPSSSARGQYVYDRDGDRVDSVYRYANDIGTLVNPFSVSLFDSAFASSSAHSAPKKFTPTASSLTADDVLVWNNTGTDFNSAASWNNTTNPFATPRAPGLNDLATFDVAKVIDPIATNTSTQTVLGIHFDTLGIGYTISGVPNAFLGIGTSGISGSNPTGANTITAGLLLNFDESITQAAGGTLNITGPVRLGNGDPLQATTITIGSSTPGSNGTINFSPSSVVIGNTIALVTNVDVTLPAVTEDPASTGAGLTKSGNGTLTLTGGGNYDGLTRVNAGTLLLTNSSGSATGSGPVLVNNGGTLSGTGLIDSGTKTITINGVLSPGANAGAGNAGTIHLASSAGAGALTLSMSSNLLFDITNSTTKDLVALTTTNVSLGGGTLTLNLGPSFDYNGTYPIFTGVSGLTGSFGTVSGYDSANFAPTFALNNGEYDLTFAAIPEPSTWIGAALALGSIVSVSRRRLRSVLS